MADQIMPGARRQRLFQVLSVACGVLLIVGGNIVYFRYFSTWKGIDPVSDLHEFFSTLILRLWTSSDMGVAAPRRYGKNGQAGAVADCRRTRCQDRHGEKHGVNTDRRGALGDERTNALRTRPILHG